MMRKILNYKTILASVLMAICVLFAGVDAEAKTITRKNTSKYKTLYSVGSTTSASGADVKINGKKLSKFNKKVKSICYGSDDSSYSYRKSSFFRYSDAYAQGTSASDGIRYVGTKSYNFTFLKPGTYTISYVTYSNRYNGDDYYQLQSSRSQVVNGERLYYYTLQQIVEDAEGNCTYQKVSTDEFVQKENKVVTDDYTRTETYYQGVATGKIYVKHSDYGVCPAVFKKGADGNQYLYIEPIVVKTVHSRTYKVLKNTNPIASVQLGKAKISTKVSSNGTSSQSTYTSKKFLSGKNGKLTVKMSDKNFAIQSIVVQTYDAQGKAQYQIVKNKKKITFGNYKYLNEYKNMDGEVRSRYTSLFKPTTVYVFYKNKYTGDACKIDRIYKDQYGEYRFDYTYSYQGDKQPTVVKDNYYLPYKDDYVRTYTFYKK